MRKPVRFGCGIEAALAVVGGKWKVLILWNLSQGRLRFGELRRRVAGISEKILIQQLRELEADGVVSRQDFGEVPPRVEYAVTPFGITLAEALRPLCEWGKTHTARIEATKSASGEDASPPAVAPAIACGEPAM